MVLRGEDIVEERYTIDADERRREYVMLGLRLGKGISDSEYRATCGRGMLEDMPMIEKFVSAGYLVREGDRVAFLEFCATFKLFMSLRKWLIAKFCE